MTQLEFENILNNDISIIENRLVQLLPSCANGQDEVVEAMRYSISNGGKRLRPVLCLEFAKACGADRYDALDFELSLISSNRFSFAVLMGLIHAWNDRPSLCASSIMISSGSKSGATPIVPEYAAANG